MPRSPANAAGETVVGVVDNIVPGGAGLMRDGGGVVFVRGALPGERVKALVERRQKQVRHAVVLEVLTPSPERVHPDCALHPRCGGCELLDFSTPAQHAAKTAMVKDALLRVGKLGADVVTRALAPLVAPPAGAALELIGRRRARFVVVKGALTFSAPASHDRVPVEDCLALHAALRAALPKVAAAFANRSAASATTATPSVDGLGLRLACDDRGHVSAALDLPTHITPSRARAPAEALVAAGAASGAVVISGDDVELLSVGDPVLVAEVSAGAFQCTSDAAVFTQATRFGGGAIRDEVMRACGAVDGKRVLELFAGAGHLTIPLLDAGARVEAVEGAARAVRFLEQNVAGLPAALARAKVRRGYIDGALVVDDIIADPIDILVADPPRTGIPGFDALLARVQPKRIVLVSCDPATGARDIALAVKRGFTLERLVPIDAFPRTSHVEWVATLLSPS